MIVDNFSRFLREVRAPYFAAMALPILLGAAIARVRDDRFDFGTFALALVGGIFLQAGTTMANDYFDDGPADGEAGWHLLPPEQVLQGALAFFVVGAMIGLYLAALTGPAVLLLGGIGILSGYFYSAPPLRLSGTGVGELLAGLNLSVLTTLGSYYVQAYRFAWEPVLAALPLAFLTAAALALHGFQPAKIHSLGGRSLWASLGAQRAPLVYAVLATPAFGLLILGVGSGILPVAALVALLALPAAVLVLRAARSHRLTGAVRAAIVVHLSTAALLILGYLLFAALRAS